MATLPDISIPQARRIVVDTTGAQIVQEESPEVGNQILWELSSFTGCEPLTDSE